MTFTLIRLGKEKNLFSAKKKKILHVLESIFLMSKKMEAILLSILNPFVNYLGTQVR